MQYVIIDTSSMLFGFAGNSSVFESVGRRFPGHRKLVSKGIINELNRLSINKGKKGACARLSLLEIKAKKIQVDRSATYADSWVLHKAKQLNAITITNDTALARRLAAANLKVFKISRNGMLKQVN